MGCNSSFTRSLNTFLPWNGWIILHRLNTTKDFATTFPSLTLRPVNFCKICINPVKYFLSLFQNHYSKQNNHTTQRVPYGGSRFPTKSYAQNFKPPTVLNTTRYQKIECSTRSSLYQRPYNKQKTFLIVFSQILFAVHVFSLTNIIIWKDSLEPNLQIQNSV